MTSKIIAIILILMPIFSFGQADKNKISFLYFNDLVLGEKSISTNFYGQFDREIVLMDNEVLNYTLQIEYERWIRRNIFVYGRIGYSTKKFKGMLERKSDGPSMLYFFPKEQKYDFLMGGLGLKYYFEIEKLKLYSKLGLNSGYALTKPEDFRWTNKNEILHLAKRINSFLVGLGLTNPINEKLNLKVEVSLNNSINPIIKEIESSKQNIFGLGIGVEYNFK